MKRLFTALAFALLATTLLAAAESITPSSTAPTLDGIVAAGEYTWTKDINTATISANLGTDGLLYLAISAPTSGWVALGFGSDRMDNALIAMAYDDGKTPFFTEQTGKGHSHSDAKDQVIKQWSVKTVDGKTTLEIAVPADSAKSMDLIKVIYAYGKDKNIHNYHAKRGSLTFAIKS